MPKKKTEELNKQPPRAMVLDEYTPKPDPWRSLRESPGIRILSTAQRLPGD